MYKRQQYDLLTVPGNAAALATLREAGADSAELLIAATSTDETNILCCLVAKRLNPGLHTIARVRSYEYAEQLFLMREDLGLSMSINPEPVSYTHLDVYKRQLSKKSTPLPTASAEKCTHGCVQSG